MTKTLSTDIIQHIIEAQQKHIEALANLVEKSESRIDRTNDMICKLAAMTDQTQKLVVKLTEEYTHHLKNLSQCRDTLLQQNDTLLRMHESDVADKRELHEEIKFTSSKIFHLLNKMSLGSNAGVKIENNFDDR